MSAVRTEGLTKVFSAGFRHTNSRPALDGLTLAVPAGGVFGLLGPNGAGKSTTLKLLVGLLRPSSGRAELLGRPPGDSAARQGLGFLPENPTFYDHLTAEELLTYFAGIFGIRGGDRTRRVAAVLERVGLGAERRRPLRQYSKGMVQRVGLAQALVNDPELVILDEPMSGLDPVGRREVREMIAGFGREGRTVLFSSHILSDAQELCGRVAILDRGRLVAEGRVADLTAGGVRGWSVVVSIAAPGAGLPGDVAWTDIGDGLARIDVSDTVSPEALIARLSERGARLVSVTPYRASLEDAFVRAVGGPRSAPEAGSQGGRA